MKHRIIEIDVENESLAYLLTWRYRFALLERRKFLYIPYWKTIASADNPADFENIICSKDIKVEYLP